MLMEYRVNPVILTMGLNHMTAPISVREQVARASCVRDEALERMDQAMAAAGFSESLILSTCNRTEVYAVAADLAAAERTLPRLFGEHDAFPAAADIQLYHYADREAVAHLFAVASGIDSMIVGEFEILGQVRRAYLRGVENQTVGPVLHQLFKDAIHVGKRAHSETAIGTGAVSIASAAVAVARERLGTLEGRQVLVIGAGDMGRRAARNLALDGASTVMVSNRTYSQAAELATEIGGRAISFDELGEALAEADLVISATSAPHLILGTAIVDGAMRERPGRSLYVIDIAVPRDVDPAVGAIPGVDLLNIDDLEQHIDANRAVREQAMVQVQAIIEQEVERFWDWHMERRAVPVLAGLHEHAEAIRSAELDKAFRRLGHLRLNERDRNVIAALSAGIVKKLLAAPTTHLKERVRSGDGQVYLDTVRELFELDSDENREIPPTL
jgi:glutamyl-tRNA reductase